MDMSTFDVTKYPPAPILWVTYGLDVLCWPLQCSHWRSLLVQRFTNNDSTPWWQVQVPSLFASLPKLLTYSEFVAFSPSHHQPYSLESMRAYAATPSTSLGDLTSLPAILTLLVLVVCLRSIKAVVLPIFRDTGRRAGRSTHGPDWESSNAERITKFGEYVFRLLYHSAISAYGLWYFWDKPWWNGDTLSLFRGFPNHEIQPGMAWYYLLQAAYNVDALIALLELSFVLKMYKGMPRIEWSPTVRGDFREMMVHHLVTNALVVGSSMCRLTRIGSMVFLIHDVSDVPIDLSKLANFLKWKTATIACFVTMVLAWAVTRLYILPFVIYYSVLTESHYVLEQGLPPLLYLTYRHFFYALIAVLILLHVVWFGVFLQIFYTIVQKNEVHDYSEHKHGEVARPGFVEEKKKDD